MSAGALVRGAVALCAPAAAQVLGATGDGKKRQASKAKEAVKQVEAAATKLLESKGSDTGAGMAVCV